MMQSIEKRNELAQRKHMIEEERSFYTRAHADVVMGLWAGRQLGLGEEEAKLYAASVMEAGVTSPGGRGGFDKLALDLAPLRMDAEALRGRYAQAMASYKTGHA